MRINNFQISMLQFSAERCKLGLLFPVPSILMCFFPANNTTSEQQQLSAE